MSSKYDNVQKDIDKFNNRKSSYMSSKYDNVQKDIDKFNANKARQKRIKKQKKQELNNLLEDSPSKRINLNKEIKAEKRRSKVNPLYQFAG